MKGIPIGKGNLIGAVAEGFAQTGLERLLLDPDKLFSEPGARILKQMGNTRTLRFSWEGKELFLKHYLPRSWVQSCRGMVGGSRGRKAADRAEMFLACGIPTPQPIVLLERKRLGVPAESYLCYEFSLLVENLAQRYRGAGDQDFLDSGILHNIGKDVARMHGQGLFHGDLKWSNILVSREGRGIALLVDLDGAGRINLWNRSRRAEDLSRFLVNLVENMEKRDLGVKAFLQAYLEVRGASGGASVQFLAQVRERMAAKLEAHSRRRGHAIPLKESEISDILNALI